MTIAVVLVAVFHTLGLLSSIDAVFSTRTPQGAIAWVVSLNTLPYVAVPAYWVFGRSRFHGYVTARRGTDERTDAIERAALRTIEPFIVSDSQRPEATVAAEGLAAMPVLRGNQVELLIDGEETFESILQGIDRAEDYVLVQFYIIHDDELGRTLKERLIAKRQEGVRVYLLYDEVGSHSLPNRYKQELQDAGAEVYDFHTRKGPNNRFQLNFRNHRKIVVVDGQEAWIGGHNVGDEYLGKDPKFGHWRDTHVRIRGPAVLKAQLSFLEDWYWATERGLELSWSAEPAEDGSDARVLIIPSGPADPFETANLMFVHAIDSAQKRIWIASPYFVPDHSVIVALQLAGLRGVDVRILIPDNPDHLLVYMAAYSYFEQAGQTGVKFYRYQDGFLHEKVMLIDDSVATVGTANFDNRSFRLNFEVTAAIGDPVFVDEVTRMFEEDFAKSRLMAADEYRTKPWYFKLGVKLADLTAPIL